MRPCDSISSLYLTWRAWRHGVKVTASSVFIQGLLYDRRIPLTSVSDVSLGFIIWDDAEGRVRSSIVTAFAELGPTPDFIHIHNQRSLERVRRHALGTRDTLDNQWRHTGPLDSRDYDRPEVRRPQQTDSGKRAGRRNRVSDAWPTLVLLFALTLGSVLGLCLTVGPALWLYDLAPTPGSLRLSYSSDPYNIEETWDLVALLGPLAIIFAVAAARLAYLMFRPPPRR